MTRVISSPSSSTSGLFTLIFAIVQSEFACEMMESRRTISRARSYRHERRAPVSRTHLPSRTRRRTIGAMFIRSRRRTCPPSTPPPAPSTRRARLHAHARARLRALRGRDRELPAPLGPRGAAQAGRRRARRSEGARRHDDRRPDGARPRPRRRLRARGRARQSGMQIIVATGLYTYDEVPHYFATRGVDHMAGPLRRATSRAASRAPTSSAAILKCATDEQGVTPRRREGAPRRRPRPPPHRRADLDAHARRERAAASTSSASSPRRASTSAASSSATAATPRTSTISRS